MVSGTLHVASVDPVSGEETASGELMTPGARGGMPFRAARGESITTRAPELATRIATRVRALDAEHGAPIRARFEIADDQESLATCEPAALAPAALVRVLVERVDDGRMTRAQAIARITPTELEAAGTFVIEGDVPTAIARGLAASPGAAAGRLSLPADFAHASSDPRIVVVDDAAPEDAMAIRAAVAIVATSGGLTADAAIAARALRKPCVVSAPIRLGDRAGPSRGDWVTVDGTRGEIFAGRVPTRWTPSGRFAAEFVRWLACGPDERPGDALLGAKNAAAQARNP